MLIEKAGRGSFQITERGLSSLAQRPAKIDVGYLEQYPEFVEFKARTKTQRESGTPEEAQRDTPEELIESGYQALQTSLAADLLDRMRSMPPALFERLVLKLLLAMGYGGFREDAGQAVGRSGDEGIDGFIDEDKLGLDRVYLQAKRWEDTVGRPDVQAFSGSLDGQRARKGVFITTSRFSAEALEYVGRIEKRIVLIDGEKLAGLMIEHGVGVSAVSTYVVRRVDSSAFGEE